MCTTFIRLALFSFALLLYSVTVPVFATQIIISNQDGSGEGFNDTTAVSPVGGNSGTTIGEQRLEVFRHAAKVWSAILNSNVNIIVEANFNPLDCGSNWAILGSAGAITAHSDFTNKPVANTWYSPAQANSLSGGDVNGSTAEIGATFNSKIDNDPTCLGNYNWYYGLDGNKPGNTIELLSVVMHEIGHGLGFQTFVDITNGRRLGWPSNAKNDAFMLNLEDHSLGATWGSMSDGQRENSAEDEPDLHWIGPAVSSKISEYSAGVNSGHIKMYAPNPLELGSSVSHFSKTLAPNELMEPSDTGPKTGPGLAKELMTDLGWVSFPNSKPYLSTFADESMLQGDNVSIDFVIGDDDTSLSSLTLSGTSSNQSLVQNGDISFSGTGNTRTLDVTALTTNTGTTTINISVGDGTTVAIESFDLTIQLNNAPTINVTSPPDNSAYFVSDVIDFQATANDTEDGELNSAIQWSSSLTGTIGNGASVSSGLSAGVHIVTASVADSLGKSTESIRTVTIVTSGDSDADNMDDVWELTFFGTLDRDGTGDFDTDGLIDSVEEQLSTDPTLTDSDSDGISDGDEVNLYNIDPLASNLGDVGPRLAPDDVLNASDIVILTRLVTGIITPVSPEDILGDLNNDSQINAADLLLLQKLILNTP